jgi:deoxyribodipyrimidine photo-lyase
MWFASIWIFTLRLPWELGADFFLRHLLDGDPASNTLGWRWVAGIQTRGKTYLARASNIEKYTRGRFNPEGQLALSARPVPHPTTPDRKPLPASEWMEPRLRTGLLLHDDDLAPGHLLEAGLEPVATAFTITRKALSPLEVSQQVLTFAKGAQADVEGRWGPRLGTIAHLDGAAAIAAWAKEHGLEQIVTPYAPTGPNADLMVAIGMAPETPPVRRIMRSYDRAAWPNATGGFFKFKDKIPKLIGQLNGRARPV